MMIRHALYVFLALMTANAAAAGVLPDAGGNEQIQRTDSVRETTTDSSENSTNDLTGYWRQADGQTFYFVQEGATLISRHLKQSAQNDENDIDFTATVHGNLIYGAHRGPFSRAMQKNCSRQIWVGMGLTLDAEGNLLKGFRGDRIVDPKNCSAENSAPVEIVYTRVTDADGNPLK